jgi:predicted metal-dependent hydrolase
MRRKTLSLMVTNDGIVLIKAPLRTPEKYILDFVNLKKAWINKKIEQSHTSKESLQGLDLENLDIVNQKKIAKAQVSQKIQFWSGQMNLKYQKVRLSSAKTRWGSCTSTNDISINWRLSLLPLELMDYVIVHELAHIREKNHSSKFWAIVESYWPNYKSDRKLLKSYGLILSAV